MRKQAHCPQCPVTTETVCPCDCHPYGLRWRTERQQRLDWFEDLFRDPRDRRRPFDWPQT